MWRIQCWIKDLDKYLRDGEFWVAVSYTPVDRTRAMKPDKWSTTAHVPRKFGRDMDMDALSAMSWALEEALRDLAERTD